MSVPTLLRGGVRPLALVAVFLFGVAPSLVGQSAIFHEEGYLAPPGNIAELVTAPRHEVTTLSNLGPAGDHFLNLVSPGLASLADLAKDYYRLGGLALDPAANRNRNLTTRGSVGVELIHATTGRVTPIGIPAGATVSSASWSPDGERVGFLVNRAGDTHIYVAEVAGGEARRVTASPLMATRVTSFEWSGDGAHVFAVVLPEGRGAEPVRPAQPTTPLIRVAQPDSNRLRTYPSLLKDPHDRDLLEYYTTGQLVRIDVASGATRTIGSPAMIESISVDPSGEHVRVRTTQKPFSFIVPVSQFGDLDEVWDLNGNSLVELERREAREGVSSNDDDDTPPRRSLAWRPDGQGLSFLQREAPPEDAEGGNNNQRKDRVMQWLPPFEEGSERVVFESDNEIRSLQYSADASWLFLTERVRGTDRLYAVHVDDPETRYVLAESDSDDFYDNPGSLMTAPNELGVNTVRTSSDGASVYLSGTAFFEDPDAEAPRPFVDRVVITTGDTERIWESAADVWERVADVLDDDLNRVVLTRESPTMVPDSWLLDRSSGQLSRLTQNVDPHPVLTQARRERIDVTRADGVTFKVDVTLPADYQEGTRLPAMFWFYPREFESEDDYQESTRTYNKNRFPMSGARSLDILTAHGYAVVEPDHPIIGPPNRINDNYIPDLQANHLAVIDELDERGWIDRRRLGLGGHSYGGFGTINAMVNTPYFRAGIAGAPNSNRLLTPIGFQREQRTLWEAREVYLSMSPFLWADRLSGALLIYHGEDDQNVGTFPDNSWRLIHALNGLGKTAALYMYPFEDHGQIAEETLLDMWARWTAWLDYFLKDSDPSTPPTITEDVDSP